MFPAVLVGLNCTTFLLFFSYPAALLAKGGTKHHLLPRLSQTEGNLGHSSSWIWNSEELNKSYITNCQVVVILFLFLYYPHTAHNIFKFPCCSKVIGKHFFLDFLYGLLFELDCPVAAGDV